MADGHISKNGSLIITLSKNDEETKLRQAQQIDDANYTFISTVQKQIDRVSQQLNKIQNVETKTQIQAAIDAAQKELGKVIAKGTKTAQELGLKGAILRRGNIIRSSSDRLISNKDAQQIIGDLRMAVAAMTIPNIANWLGTFEEILARYCALKMQHLANNEIINLFQKELLTQGKILTAGSQNVSTSLDISQLVSTNSISFVTFFIMKL